MSKRSLIGNESLSFVYSVKKIYIEFEAKNIHSHHNFLGEIFSINIAFSPPIILTSN
jgi:hypothetical protein